MVRTSGLELVTTTLKVKSPPGAVRVGGVAVLSTTMIGTGVSVTTASSESLTSVPPGLVARTVTTSVWLSPAAPVKGAVKEQRVGVAGAGAGCSTVPMAVVQVELGLVVMSP